MLVVSGGSMVKNLPACRSHRRHGFDPWVGKIPWRREWQSTPVFSPGESPWAEEPGRLQSWGCKESDLIDETYTHTHTHTSVLLPIITSTQPGNEKTFSIYVH